MSGWQSREVLAWTRHDGPGAPPPPVPRAVSLGLAGGLGVVFLGLMVTDTLCPEHRAWVDALAFGSLAATGSAVVALLRGSAAAGPLAFLATLGGVGIGVVDAAHAPARGWTVAGLFLALAVVAAVVNARGLRLRRWERTARAAHRAPVTSGPTSLGHPTPAPLAAAPAEPRKDAASTST
ncbi:MAG: hypothetical protein KY451_15730 [Actinobacteria bacterium]|nr:hypothetical protein [Actinomycetota bacterium]